MTKMSVLGFFPVFLRFNALSWGDDVSTYITATGLHVSLHSVLAYIYKRFFCLVTSYFHSSFCVLSLTREVKTFYVILFFRKWSGVILVNPRIFCKI